MVGSQENEEFQNASLCITLLFSPLMKVSCFLVGSQDVRHGASGDQRVSLRKFGGMRN